MTYERGDVLFGADPFKGNERSRPWLVVNNDRHPFHGAQYIVLGLTTKSWHEQLRVIPDESWIDGGTPKPSRILPWTVETLEHSDVDHWQGRIETAIVDDAVSTLYGYVTGDPS